MIAFGTSNRKFKIELKVFYVLEQTNVRSQQRSQRFRESEMTWLEHISFWKDDNFSYKSKILYWGSIWKKVIMTFYLISAQMDKFHPRNKKLCCRI